MTFTDQERYFVSESTAYRTLKAHDLITSPAFIVIKAANEFKGRPRPSISSPSHRRKRRLPGSGQTDFTYLKVLGWGWFYLSTIMDDYSRYIISIARQGIAQQCPERVEALYEYEG